MDEGEPGQSDSQEPADDLDALSVEGEGPGGADVQRRQAEEPAASARRAGAAAGAGTGVDVGSAAETESCSSSVDSLSYVQVRDFRSKQHAWSLGFRPVRRHWKLCP